MAQIKIGTVSVTNGSNVVTGVGTQWLTDNVQTGDGFALQLVSGVNGAGIYYTIGGSVTENSFQLSSNWAGDSASGVAYVVITDFLAPGFPQLLPGDLEAKSLINQNILKLINDKAALAALGTAAFANLTTGPTDKTSGRVTRVGDGGLLEEIAFIKSVKRESETEEWVEIGQQLATYDAATEILVQVRRGDTASARVITYLLTVWKDTTAKGSVIKIGAGNLGAIDVTTFHLVGDTVYVRLGAPNVRMSATLVTARSTLIGANFTPNFNSGLETSPGVTTVLPIETVYTDTNLISTDRYFYGDSIQTDSSGSSNPAYVRIFEFRFSSAFAHMSATLRVNSRYGSFLINAIAGTGSSSTTLSYFNVTQLGASEGDRVNVVLNSYVTGSLTAVELKLEATATFINATYTLEKVESNGGSVTSYGDVVWNSPATFNKGRAKLAYTQYNILGAVSQSGGVTTGAIIERGSNANGEYVKFADGTLICRHSITNFIPASQDTSVTQGITIYRCATQTWTFPQSFTGEVPDCFIGSNQSGSANLDTAHIFAEFQSNCQWDYESLVSTLTNQLTSLYLLAIGRWY